MHYYELGDLERALRQRRSKGKFLELDLLYKWLGQMIEALHYVHEQKMIHRYHGLTGGGGDSGTPPLFNSLCN